MPKRKKPSRSKAFQQRSRAARLGWRRQKRREAQRRAKRRRQAAARRKLKQIQRELERETKAHRARTEEWELTIRYAKKGKAVGITMRITAPMGTPKEVVQIVARRAGLPNGQVEQGFDVRDINWQRGVKAYDYGDDVEKGLQVSGWSGLLAAGTIRLDKVKP